MRAGLTEIRLYGVLGQRFGRRHHLAVGSVREAMHALAIVVPGFATHLLEHSEPGYRVFVGALEPGRDVGVEQLEAPVSTREPICVVPVVAGAKRGGVGQILVGAALLYLAPYAAGYLAGSGYYAAAAFVGTYGTQLAATLILGGVVQALGAREQRTSPRPENLPSYNFNGPVNTTQQGLPVPLRYGRVVCGGAIISSGISTERLVLAAPPAPMPPQDLPAEQQGESPGPGPGGDW